MVQTNACPTPYLYGDWSAGGMADALGKLATIDDDIANNSDPDVAIALEGERNEVLGYMARFYSDSGSYDTAAALLASYGKYEDALPFYLMAGDYQSANSIIGNMPTQTTDDQLYKYEMSLALTLYSNGNNWMDIDTATRDTLAGMVQYNSVAGYMAGAISALVGTGEVTWPIPEPDTAYYDSLLADTSSYGQKLAYGSEGHTVKDINNYSNHTFSLYPNPTTGDFSIVTSGEGVFSITTIDGKKVKEYKITSRRADCVLPASLANGLYIGTYRPDAGGVPDIVRFVYQR